MLRSASQGTESWNRFSSLGLPKLPVCHDRPLHLEIGDGFHFTAR
jgi:hypothetical protein